MVQQRAVQAESGGTSRFVWYENSTWKVRERNVGRLMIRSRSPAGPRRRRKRTHAIGVHPLPPAVLSVTISLATQSHAVSAERKAPCFGACALVCDLSLKAECVPAFACKSERGPFVREVENAMRNGWEQRCDGNFLAIFAGVSIGEKSNFLSRIFE